MPDDPVSTTLADLARKIGATAGEIDQLSPEVQQLTKDQLLALWGTTSTPDAYKSYLRMGTLPDPLMMPLHLTLQDVRSIQQVFTLERVQAALERDQEALYRLYYIPEDPRAENRRTRHD